MAGVDLSGEPSGGVLRLERSMLSSWPALSTSFDGDWVIRLAKGVTKRSNSVTCLGADPSDLEQRIERVEAVYERHGLPPTFRVSPLAPLALTEALNRHGWNRFDESIVMTLAGAAPVHQVNVETDIDLKITGKPDAAWLESCCRIEGTRTTDAETLSLMLERLIPEAGYGRILVDGQIAALAQVVVDDTLIGLFEVMTAKGQRRKGYSRALLSHLLRFGKKHGGTTRWLAVAADNEPAVTLYRSMGFSEVYRYHYRAKG